MAMEISMKASDKDRRIIYKRLADKSFLRDNPTSISELEGNKTPSKDNKKKFDLKKFSKLAAKVILLLVLIACGYYAYRVFSFTNNIGLKIKPQDIITGGKKDPELKKDSTGKYTNVLLVGIDSRGDKSKLQNTDTMIIASYNYDTGNTVMYSIPRDLYVEIPAEPKGYFQKINAMYATGEKRSKGGGFAFLEKAIKNTTGLEIQYHAMIDLQGFKKIIDTLGGVTVNVENSFTDTCYPLDGTEKTKYFCALLPGMAQTISFKEGPQTMNGTVALQYARSRHAAGTEGSDFARGRRQQRVLIAVKDKVLSSGTLLNPQKVLEILDALEKNLTLSTFTTEEIQAAINIGLKQKENPGKVFSFVLEPSIAGGRLLMGGSGLRSNLPGFSPQLYTVQSVDGVVPTYTELIKFVNSVQKEPQLFKEDPVIRVYDAGITYAQAQKVTTELKSKYPYLNILFMGTLYSDKTGTVVYSKEADKFQTSINTFAGYFKTTSTTKPDYITSDLNGEDLTILLGKTATETQPSNPQ
ncbi:MAG TPA: LCP family protein [Candidatus Dojkabacteria bacterium]|nr:LCP family protein [Candidatus Dojkabacteria bacterium]